MADAPLKSSWRIHDDPANDLYIACGLRDLSLAAIAELMWLPAVCKHKGVVSDEVTDMLRRMLAYYRWRKPRETGSAIKLPPKLSDEQILSILKTHEDSPMDTVDNTPDADRSGCSAVPAQPSPPGGNSLPITPSSTTQSQVATTPEKDSTDSARHASKCQASGVAVLNYNNASRGECMESDEPTVSSTVSDANLTIDEVTAKKKEIDSLMTTSSPPDSPDDEESSTSDAALDSTPKGVLSNEEVAEAARILASTFGSSPAVPPPHPTPLAGNNNQQHQHNIPLINQQQSLPAIMHGFLRQPPDCAQHNVHPNPQQPILAFKFPQWIPLLAPPQSASTNVHPRSMDTDLRHHVRQNGGPQGYNQTSRPFPEEQWR